MLIVMSLCFFLLVFKQVNSVVVVINDLYAKTCVPDIVKNLKVKVFNLMSRTNETRQIKRHGTRKCKCRLDSSVCNNKQC